MPKRGMEPIRRAALIHATIAEIGAQGSLDITVGQIARRAGVSSGLAHHYFGGKDDLLLAAMRHILRIYSGEVSGRMRAATTPWARLESIIEGSFAPSNFKSDVISAWLNFYVLALSSDEARRLHRIYAARLRSNLRHAIRGVSPRDGVSEHADAGQLANRIAQLIDGVYLSQGLSTSSVPDGDQAAADVLAVLRNSLEV